MEAINGESKIRKIIFNELTLVIALVGCISGVIFWVANPQTEMKMEIIKLQSQAESNQTVVAALEKIKNNDFVEIHKSIEQLETRQITILERLAKISSKLDIK
jgi:hypothetical protein